MPTPHPYYVENSPPPYPLYLKGPLSDYCRCRGLLLYCRALPGRLQHLLGGALLYNGGGVGDIEEGP